MSFVLPYIDHMWTSYEFPLQFLPPPPPPPKSTDARQWLKIVTGGDEAAVAAGQNVIANQQTFAKRHGYSHEVHVGNYARPWIAYWHKIDVLLRELQAPNPPKVLVWFDLDLVVTNPTLNMLEDVLAAHPNEKMILTEDANRGNLIPGIEGVKRLVNTGVILVRSSPEAERVLEKLFEFGREHRNAAYLPQDTNTLHEQDAFDSMLGGLRRHVWRRHIAVISQRSGSLNLNTFARNLYEPGRYQDPISSEWRSGDFTAHCTGLGQQLREWCTTDSIEAAEIAVATTDMCRNKTEHEAAEIGRAPVYEALDADPSIRTLMSKGYALANARIKAWSDPYTVPV